MGNYAISFIGTENIIRSLRYISVAFITILGSITIIASGGGENDGGDGDFDIGSSPSISSFTYSPTSTTVGSGEGQVLVLYSFDFIDNDGNIADATFSVFDSDDNLVYTDTSTIEGISGVTSGTINGGVYADTSIADEFLFEIYVTDTSNLESNTLKGNFIITDDYTNEAPISDAGINRSVAVNSEVTLDGSNSSDGDGDPLTYAWSIVSIPDGSVITLTDPNAVDPSFTPDMTGTYIFSLVVSDGLEYSESDTVTITAYINNGTNEAPIADAGIDKNTAVNSEVSLDGSNSSDGDGDPLTYTWSIVSTPDGSVITLTDPNAVDPSFTPDMTGTYIFSLVVSDGLEYSETDTVTIVVYTDFYMLNFRVVDAEYSEEMEKIIMISSGPNRLHIYDPITHTDSAIALPLTPTCVSVGPDGTYAAVGHDAWVSYIDLYSENVENTISVSVEALDVVLAGNGYIYVFPTEDQWTRIQCINIDTEEETSHTGNYIYAGTKAKLHPSGNAIYGADNGLSPSDIEKYSITNGTATYLYDSPYHGDYYMGGDLWISEDGLRIFTRSGNVFRSSDLEAQDMLYNGSLSQVTRVKHLDHCAMSSKVAVIPDNTYHTEDEDVELQIYSYEYLNYEESITLPCFINNDTSYAGHGSFVFINNDGSKYFVIVTADESSGMLYDQAVVTY